MFYYKVRTTGQWCGAGMSTPQDADWLDRYAVALGLAPDAIEEVESATDPRTGTLLVEPPPPPPPTSPPTLGALLAPEMSGLTLAINELKAAFTTNPDAQTAADKMAQHTAAMKEILKRG